MKKNRKKTITLLVLGFGLTTAHAQHAVTAAGGNASGSGGTSAFSVGQALYTTQNGSNGSVAQGVQQPYEISIVTDASGISLSFSVYPNPTTGFLILNVGNYKTQNLSFKLYDINGKLLESKKMENNETTILMGNNASGIYLLKIIESNKELKTFKIIKN